MRRPRLSLLVYLGLSSALAGCGSSATPTAPSATFAIAGVVREQWGLQSPPIASATVTLTTGAQAGRQVITGQDGTFSFAGVPSESVQIRASAEGFEPATVGTYPAKPTADILLAPVMTTVERSFETTAVTWPAEAVTIPFTVGRRGPVTLELSSNQAYCEASYQTVYAAEVVGQFSLAVCPPGPLTVERTEVLAPGQYAVRVLILGLGAKATDKREFHLSYPR